MRIADITCDSDISQFLNLTELENTLSVICDSAVKKLREDSLDPILKEMNSGGLDQYSLNIGGNPIANEKAAIAYKSLDESFNELATTKTTALLSGKEHRIEELNTYITKLNQKIADLQTQISSYQQKIIAAKRSGRTNIDTDSWSNAKENLKNKQETYKQKLEAAKILLNQTLNWSSKSEEKSDIPVTENVSNTEAATQKTGLIEPNNSLLKEFKI